MWWDLVIRIFIPKEYNSISYPVYFDTELSQHLPHTTIHVFNTKDCSCYLFLSVFRHLLNDNMFSCVDFDDWDYFKV